MKSVREMVKDTHSQGLEPHVECCARMLLGELPLSSRQIHAVEFRTRGQSDNALWHEYRWGRLTASRFGPIVRRSSPAGRLVVSLLHESIPSGFPALKWGRDHEAAAREAYCEAKKVNVALRGLVMEERGFIGCSPDGIVYDVNEQGQQLLEIKCPFSARQMSIENACLGLDNFCYALSADAEPSLRRNHDYYFQVGKINLIQ